MTWIFSVTQNSLFSIIVFAVYEISKCYNVFPLIKPKSILFPSFIVLSLTSSPKALLLTHSASTIQSFLLDPQACQATWLISNNYVTFALLPTSELYLFSIISIACKS